MAEAWRYTVTAGTHHFDSGADLRSLLESSLGEVRRGLIRNDLAVWARGPDHRLQLVATVDALVMTCTVTRLGRLILMVGQPCQEDTPP